MKDIMQYAVKKGIDKGFEAVEAFYNQNTSLELGVFEKALDRFSKSSIKGLGIRGIRSGKTGFAFTEKIEPVSVSGAVDAAYENMRHIDSKDETEFPKPADKYLKMELDSSSFAQKTVESKINILLEAEKYAFSCSDKIHKISHLIYGESESEDMLINSHSLDLSEKRNYGYFYINIIIKDDEKFRSGMAFQVVRNYGELDIKETIDEAMQEALSKCGAKSMASGNYTVVFKNRTFAKLLEAFFPIFTAEKVQKGLSKLKGRIGEAIAGSLVTITDDPFYEKGMMNAAFDGEGTVTQKKNVIEEGILKTYLYNMKTAKKDNTKSTGNAGRHSYKSDISTIPYNFYVSPGDMSFDEGIKKIDNGIIITDIQGLHSGVNPVSCDFSLSAQGYRVKDGMITRPVSDITVSGNFLSILKKIKCIYGDLLFDIPSAGYFGSPSVLVEDISIAGDSETE